MGNICRSPIAEGILKSLLEEQSIDTIDVDSAGTSNFNEGESSDSRALEVCKRRNIEIYHKSRPVNQEDLQKSDYIFVMDRKNYENVLKIDASKSISDKVAMIRSFDTIKSGNDVDDPYLGTVKDFERCYKILHECCTNLLNFLKYELAITVNGSK